MYNVLQVDDEQLVLDGFRTLIDWEELGLEQPDVATSAEQALDMLRCGAYHILITDIRMPGMSGLDLIAKIRELGSGVKIIILSGHDDFSYLKTAFQYGIENYLLKPVDVEELTNALTYTLDKIERERERIRVQQMRDCIVLDNVLNAWIDASTSPSALTERLQMLQIGLNRAHYQVTLVRMDQFERLDSAVTLNSREVQRIFQRSAALNVDVYATFSLAGDLVLIHGSDVALEPEEMAAYCERAMLAWLCGAAADWHAFHGDWVDDALDVPRSYAGVSRLTLCAAICPERRIYSVEQLRTQTCSVCQRTGLSEDWLGELLEASEDRLIHDLEALEQGLSAAPQAAPPKLAVPSAACCT